MTRPRRLAPRSPLALAALCAALLAPPAQAQLTDWVWRPSDQIRDYDLGQAYNWQGEATHPPTAMIRGHILWDENIARLYTNVTLGSLAIDSLFLRGLAPGASLVLGNDQNAAALVLGTGSASAFTNFNLLSSGSALVHAGHRLDAFDLNWVHDGTLVLGASTPGPNSASSTISINGSSRFGAGFGRLDVVVGSASAGLLRIENGGMLDATTLRVGRAGAEGGEDSLIVRGGQAQVRNEFDIGHYGRGLALVAGKDGVQGRLEGNFANIGFAGGEASQLKVEDGGWAGFSNLTVGTGAGSQGAVTVASGGELQVNLLQIGGGTHASLASDAGSNVSLGAVGLQGGPGFAELSTAGQAQLSRLTQGANSRWITGGATRVAGYVSVAEYGGSNVVLKVQSGGDLHVGGSMWVGDYHLSGTQPVDQRVVVESGAQLQVDGIFTLYATSELSGGGTVTAAQGITVVDGTVAPGMSPGHLTVEGDLSFAGGQLVIELGGLQPGSEHDVLEVLGTLTLGQWGRGTTLVLQAVDGFVPQADQGFDFLRAGQFVGSFAALVDETGLGLTLDDLEFANGHMGINLAAAVVAVPEPSVALLMLAGAGLLMVRRRRLR